jgi:recombination protein RecA
MHRFDIEVEGSHNYLVDGVVVHNSPETTPGGRALKFYSSIRLDIRRIEQIKDGTDVVGNRTRVKVVKNKCAAPFRQAEFDIMYGKGISREGSLLDVALELGFVKKSGAWFTYEGEQLGQGRENVKTFLSENPQLMAEINDRVRACLAPQDDAEADTDGEAQVHPDDLPITLDS